MQANSLQMQVYYEIAMSIGNSLDLRTMLNECLSVYLRKLNCAAGAVFRYADPEESLFGGQLLFSIPRRFEARAAHATALEMMAAVEDTHPGIAPRVALDADRRHLHLFQLPDFGWLLLVKGDVSLAPSVMKSLTPLNAKLARACTACLQAARVERTAEQLRLENNERRKAEQALKESHERFITVMDSIDATIYVADMQNYEIVFMNRYMKDKFGHDLEGKKCWAVFRDHGRPCPHCTNDRLLDAKKCPAGVIVWEDKNPLTGDWYINYDRAIKWVDGRMVRLQIATDITKLKLLEEERSQTEAQLRQAQKLESIGTLAGGVAHDFNNLMTGMLGNIALVLYDLEATHPHRARLKKVEKLIHSGARLTGQLLGYARKGKYTVRPLDINRIVSETAETCGRTRKEMSIHARLGEGLPKVAADEVQLEQVLLNLYVNAADAMPDGGDLYLTTSRVGASDIPAKLRPRPVDQYARIEVTDTGCGMDAEVLDRIFDPFYTTKPMGRGTGLGLASAYGIVRSHGGCLDVRSQKHRGTTFMIYLPAAQRASTTDGACADGVIQCGQGTILLVDDEEMVAKVGLQMLERFGYRVHVALSGDQAINLHRRYKQRIDLVILDMIMPGMGGGEVFDRMKTIQPDVKVLLSSGYGIDGQAQAIIDRGCKGFIQKPFKMAQLSRIIKDNLDTYPRVDRTGPLSSVGSGWVSDPLQ